MSLGLAHRSLSEKTKTCKSGVRNMSVGQKNSMRARPKVSVGTPVYNGEKYLPELLDCITKQTFNDFEIIICDNASTDCTAQICREYERVYPQISYVRNGQNIGAVRNYNRVFELGVAPYFKWTAHDDLYEPSYLERCVEILDRCPDVVLAHANMSLVDSEGYPIEFDDTKGCYVDPWSGVALREEPAHLAESVNPEQRFRDVLHLMFWCTAIFGVIRRSALARTSLHRSYYGSDKVLLAELALLGRFCEIDDTLFIKRCHPQMSHYKSTRERAKWIDPAARQLFPPLQLFHGYAAAAIGAGSLSLQHRASCIASVLRKTAQAGYWRRRFAFDRIEIFGKDSKSINDDRA